MGPVYVIHVIEYIGDMKRDVSHCVVKRIIIKIVVRSTFYFLLSRWRCCTFDDDRYHVVPITNTTCNISDMVQQ